MKNREFIKGVAVGAAAAVVITGAGNYGVQKLLFPHGNVLSDRSHVEKLQYLEKLIDENYLEEKDEDDLAEGMYAGLISGLKDPYSRYYTAEQYAEENTSSEGSYTGIGVVMQQAPEGGGQITECYEGASGEQAGLKVNDVITAVDGEDVTEMSISDIASLIRKSDKDSVVLTIQRENEAEALEIEVPIKNVEIKSVSYEMLDDHIGYIRISQFTGVTGEQYKAAFKDLKKQNMEKMIVDLRGNPGGLLTSVCEVLREILPEGLIVYTEDKYGHREEEKCDGSHQLDMPLAVLVNENSASASEIFAGAVKDYGTGTIVGTTTYGKGVVQSIQPLSDGSAVKLTISKYYTPKGNDINKVGIEPDVKVELDAGLSDKTEITHEEDNQLQAAIQVLKGEKEK